jgi:hypothetical protein
VLTPLRVSLIIETGVDGFMIALGGAVRGRSMLGLSLSANDGADGGKAGIEGMGSRPGIVSSSLKQVSFDNLEKEGKKEKRRKKRKRKYL